MVRFAQKLKPQTRAERCRSSRRGAEAPQRRGLIEGAEVDALRIDDAQNDRSV